MRNKCELYTSSYEEAFGCFSCKSAISNNKNQCVNYCPYGFINALSKTCVKCNTSECESFDTKRWTIERIDNNEFRLRPTRKILSDIEYDHIFVIKVNGTDQLINYTKIVNKEHQYINITLDLKENINSKTLDFILVSDPNNPEYM